MMQMPRSSQASIIINTYNRASHLKRLLVSLPRLRDVDFEVIVVNGPSTDGTARLLEQYQSHIKIAKCPSRNLSQSRNIGIAAAAGDIVAFIDDDALPADEYWLARYLQAFAADPDLRMGAAGGPVWHKDTYDPEFDGGATSDYGFQVFNRSPQGHEPLDELRWVSRVPGGNCAYRRSALVQIGGFDEYYTYYLDETDVCVRLARAGFRIAHLPDNPIRHYSAPSGIRTSPYDRNWRIITRSDTYFALKNGADPLPLRFGKTIAYAPHKHFFYEINRYFWHGQVSILRWLWALGKWFAGLISGSWAGLRQTRQLVNFAEAPAFLRFNSELAEQPLRIAFLTQTIPGQASYGGIGRYTYDLARGLHERGHEVHIICKDEQAIRYEGLGFFIHGLPAAAYAEDVRRDQRPILAKNIGYASAVMRKLYELYTRGIVFDVVHASNWDTEAVAIIRTQVYPVALMLVSPLAQVVLTENWTLNDDLKACIALDRWQIEQASTVCIPSEGVLKSYQALMNIQPESIAYLQLIPLGIVPDHAPPDSVSHSRLRLLFVGRLERRKGAQTLLQVLPDLLQRNTQWECHLVGDDRVPLIEGGTLKDRFLAQYHNAPWLDRVIFHGSVAEEELRQHYQNCDLFVAPSLFESFGLIYHEAMQYGKAVVGCHTGGVPEVVEHGVEGLLVPPDDPEDLRKALLLLMGNDSLRKQMGQAGWQRVHQVTNYHTMAAQAERVYQETIDRVGAACKARRTYLWPRELALFDTSTELQWSGAWSTREAVSGHLYRLGDSEATLTFHVRGGDSLRLTLLRHSWSGILEAILGDALPIYIDLFKPGDIELDYSVDIPISIDPEECVRVKLRVHPERNPESYASQVWLKRIAVIAAGPDTHLTSSLD
jgi:glycogen(starch) synthase